jgi:hypothetical protein|tara:strand:- start:171 stop:578 length:408 start_codon:yes stop_codon:yes gene_type:complete
MLPERPRLPLPTLDIESERARFRDIIDAAAKAPALPRASAAAIAEALSSAVVLNARTRGASESERMRIVDANGIASGEAPGSELRGTARLSARSRPIANGIDVCGDATSADGFGGTAKLSARSLPKGALIGRSYS